MDVKQMLYIVTIAQEGGISRAAAKLFITQSALDQQLLKLEHELGTPLFCRSRGSVSLTEAGRVYVEYAKQILELKNEAYRIIHDLAGQRRGTLSLAFAPERGMEMFVDVYPQFYQEYPQIKVVPREVSVRQQLDLLAGDELDLGFISHRGGPLSGIEQIPLLREEFLLITPLDHPLASQAAPAGAPLTVLAPSALRDLTLCLIYRQSTQREVIDPLLEAAGGKVSLFLETASNRANISMVQRGLSCSILPAHYIRGVEGVARFRLASRPAWIVSACHRRGRYLSQAARRFIRLAGEYFQREAPAACGDQKTRSLHHEQDL